MGSVYGPQLEFALALHRLLPGERKNVVWSPYSVASALGLVAAGAEGATRSEITALIAPGGTTEELGRALTAAATLEPGAEDAEIAVANPLWVHAGMPVREAYEHAVRATPGGAVHAADFVNDAEGARERINAEVAKVTRGRITELVGPGQIDPDTLAVLVSALWVRFAWANLFAERGTRPLPFHTPDGVRERPTMVTQRPLPYARADGWTIVTLPGTGGPVVDVLVPDGEPDEAVPAPAAAAPSAATVAALLAAQVHTEVRLYLPRFAVESSFDLIPPLMAAGVQRIFTDHADLSGISPWDLRISRVAHRAVLEADEAGLEGAAATVVMAAPGSAAPPPPPEPVVVRADRPFLVLVRQATTLLFLAHIADPATP